MGAIATTSNPADFANRLQTYFNPKLLEATENELVLATYGVRQGYKINGTTIRFFRPRSANRSGVAAIAEGVTPTNKTEVAVGYVDVPLGQRGALAEITDLVLATDLLNTTQVYVVTMGADAALDLDSVIRDSLAAGLLNSDAAYGTHRFERFAGVTPTGDSSVDFATFNAMDNANAKMTRARHLANVTQLRTAKVKTIGGKYVAVTPPEVIHDIREDTVWVAAATQVNNQALYKRGVIELDGCVFVEADNGHREADVYGTYNEAGENFGVIYLGRDAFGCPNLKDKRAGGDQMRPKMIILASADKADPLNLKTTIGWKSMWGTAPFITNVAGEVPRYLVFRAKSTFA
jgi:N4-gp56 family major capsid protein